MTQNAARPEPTASSLAAWAALPEDEPGEFIDGQIEEEEVPDLVHELIVAWLVRVLGVWIAPRGGFVFGSEVKLAVSASRGRKPDVSVYLPGGPPLPRRGAVSVPPDVAIEVVSPNPRDGRRDRIEKVRDYAAFGIRYYWLLDPELRTLEILELGRDGRYVRALDALGGRLESIPGCEGLSLDLSEAWAEIERLDPPREE